MISLVCRTLIVGACVSPFALAQSGDQLQNFQRVSQRLFCGGDPKASEDFALLAEQGVRTIVSVDGATPSIALASEYGIRYVHIPIGYDSIATEAQLALTHVAREIDGPIYVHCHHGRHRGPAAAAVIAIAMHDATSQEGIALLQRSGTSRNYGGLWQSVREFRTPPADAVLPELQEVSAVSTMAATMVQIDRLVEHLKDLSAPARLPNDDQAPQEKPEQQSKVENALLLVELIHELNRSADATYDKALWRQMATFEEDAIRFNAAVRGAESADEASAERAIAEQARQLARLGKSCTQCHQQFRN